MTEALVWIDPSGNRHSLTDPNSYFWLQGAAGFGMPKMNLQEQEVPLQAGSIPRLVLAKTRDILLPLAVKGSSFANLWSNYEALCSMFYSATTQTPGTLRRTTPNGHARDLPCFYIEGAELDESEDNYGPSRMVLAIALHACQSFWQDTDFTVKTFSPGGLLNFFDSPFLPLKLSPSGISSSFSIINSGDDLSYPLWTVNGPATAITFSNTYTLHNGATVTKTLALTLSLGSSDVLTINTDPLNSFIKKQDGSNQINTISLTSSLWPFVVGNNQCAVALSGSSSSTEVILQYKQRYLAP